MEENMNWSARDHNKKYCQATVIQLFGNFFFRTMPLKKQAPLGH